MPAAARLGGDAGADVRALVARGRVALAALGRRRRPRRLRGRARLRQGAPDLRRPDRDAPGDRLQARRHGDRDRRRPPAGLGGGLAPRPGRGRAAGGHARLRPGAARRPRGRRRRRPGVRRPRLHARVPARDAPAQRPRLRELRSAGARREDAMPISFDKAENTLAPRRTTGSIALERMRPDLAQLRRRTSTTCRRSGSTGSGRDGRKGAGRADGVGDGFVQVCIQAEELCWGDAALYLRMPTPALGGSAVAAAGTNEQKARFLRRSASERPPDLGRDGHHRAERRQRRGGDRDHGRARRRRVGAERHQDLLHRRRGRLAGAGRLRRGVGDRRQERRPRAASSPSSCRPARPA